MKHIVDDRIILSRAPEGPLAAHVGSFARSLREQGYAVCSIRRKVMIATGFNRWLKQQGVALPSVASDHPSGYLRYRARQVRLFQGDGVALRQLLDFLRNERVIPTEKSTSARSLTPVERCAQAYGQYLRDTRGLAAATIVNYVPFIRTFLKDCFGDAALALSHLCARDVVGFVQRQAPRLHPKRSKILTAALRSFLRYVRYLGKTKLNLAAAVPVVANWSMSSIPRAIGKDQVRQLLASIDRSTAIGRRDYAILLLLARLGLRSGEVMHLELGDIDWNRGQMTVRGKSGPRSGLPLPAEVGKAIAAYLRRGRPPSTSRRVFLRARAPICALRDTCSVGGIVRHYLERAGVDAPSRGAHQFRYGLATEMFHQGASLSEIGDLLGHHSPETTKIYIELDLDGLRTLALPWPGGVR